MTITGNHNQKLKEIRKLRACWRPPPTRPACADRAVLRVGPGLPEVEVEQGHAETWAVV
ncbi:MAG: hypothetical protein ACLP0J_06120 [Solirubrobacteraceae bacterium]|jgi:hypothetical protein